MKFAPVSFDVEGSFFEVCAYIRNTQGRFLFEVGLYLFILKVIVLKFAPKSIDLELLEGSFFEVGTHIL